MIQIPMNAIALYMPCGVVQLVFIHSPPSRTLTTPETSRLVFNMGMSRVLLQKLLCLVHLGRQVRAAATIGVVQEHQGTVGLANLVLGDGTLTIVTLVSANMIAIRFHHARLTAVEVGAEVEG